MSVQNIFRLKYIIENIRKFCEKNGANFQVQASLEALCSFSDFEALMDICRVFSTMFEALFLNSLGGDA